VAVIHQMSNILLNSLVSRDGLTKLELNIVNIDTVI